MLAVGALARDLARAATAVAVVVVVVGGVQVVPDFLKTVKMA